MNKASFTTTNDQIIQYLFEHRETFQNQSLSEIVKSSFFSQSSFSRFFQSNHVKSFQEYKVIFSKYEGEFSQFFSGFIRSFKKDSEEKIISDVIAENIENVEAVGQIPKEQLDAVLQIIHKYNRIIFMGSDFSMAALTVFQHILMYEGKNCYLLSNFEGQETFSSRLQKDDLVIVVSIKQRWYSDESIGDTIPNLLNSEAYKMLWTLEDNHKDKEKFDYVFQFGKHINGFGYTQLTTLSPVLTNLYCKKYLQKKTGTPLR